MVENVVKFERSPRSKNIRKPPRKTARLQPVSWGEPLKPKSLEHWRYQWHEATLKRWDLPRSAIAVAGVLMHHYRADRGYAEIGVRRLGTEAGCSHGTVVAALRKLRSAGLIAVLNEGVKVRGTKVLEVHKYRLIYRSRGFVE